jgi:hypothetical protein
VTITVYEPGATHAAKKLPLKAPPPPTVHVTTPGPIARPETVQVVSVSENPPPVKVTGNPAWPLLGPLTIMVGAAFTLVRSEVAVEMSNTVSMSMVLAVLSVEVEPDIEQAYHDLLW